MWWRLFPLFKQKRTFESGLFSRASKLITAISSIMIGGVGQTLNDYMAEMVMIG